jgi:hypothetical protein
VVAGAVFASAGSLTVITRNRRIELRPLADGTTQVVSVKDAERAVGTRVEIGFGPTMPDDGSPFRWVHRATRLALDGGEQYRGLSSAYWYDAAQFHELLLACGAQPVRSLIAQLDGCSGGKAGEIVAGGGLGRTACQDVTRAQAEQLLKAARKRSRPVASDRLGAVGRNSYPGGYYAIERGLKEIGADEKLQAIIPYVVEAWAVKVPDGGSHIFVDICINRTPSTGHVHANYDDKEMSIYGSGLRHGVANAPKKGAYKIWINVTTPFCPITSDGKAPDLHPFLNAILGAIATATRKAQRAAPDERKVS